MNSGRPESGRLITFEGGEGTGKSTQLRRLGERLRQAGRSVTETREPGGSPGAEEIRHLILNGPAEKWLPLTEALLIYAARTEHFNRVILPCISRGDIVLSDRFADSSLAYQGIASDVGVNALQSLNEIVLGSFKPDLTLILELPVQQGLSRAASRGGENRFESKGEAYHERVRQAFAQIARENPDRCVVIDARDSEEVVSERIHAAIKLKFPSLVE